METPKSTSPTVGTIGIKIQKNLQSEDSLYKLSFDEAKLEN
jgi:hypothetical protein